MNFWFLLPRRMRTFLLRQPLSDKQLERIRESLALSEEEQVRQQLDLTWKRSYSMITALIVLILSAYIMYCILR